MVIDWVLFLLLLLLFLFNADWGEIQGEESRGSGIDRGEEWEQSQEASATWAQLSALCANSSQGRLTLPLELLARSPASDGFGRGSSFALRFA